MPTLLRCALMFALLVTGRAGAETLRVATYNIENAFDVFDDPYTGDEGSDVKPRAEWQAIADAITESDADAVFFQELENEALLVALVAEFLPDGGYDFVAAVPTNSERGINLGVISRVPLRSVGSHRWDTLTHPTDNRTWRYSRDLMEVDLAVGERTVRVYNVHLKSNRDGSDDPRSMIRRTAEALGLKRHVVADLQADPNALVLAVGDFNSDYMAQDDGARPFPALAQLMRPAPELDGTRPLLNVLDGRPRDQRVTLPGGGRYPPASFDHILASPALHDRLKPDTARVLPRPEGTYGSDHLLVVAEFDLD